MIIAGIDEAGYGPTLGPLVVSAAAFEVPDPPEEGERSDLWSLLGRSVTRKPDGARIPVDDSKKIYKPGKGLRNLEEGVLPFLQLRDGNLPGDLRELVRRLMRRRAADEYLESYPWYRGRTARIPAETYANYVRVLAGTLAGELEERGIRFLGIASIPIEVIQFNRVLERRGNKALIPFLAIARLLERLWRSFPTAAIEAVVDRQGGRIRYAPLLFKALRPQGILIERQEEELSVYRLRRRLGTLRVTFTRQGDSKDFAVALASMVSKYLRELHMAVFNGFWAERSAGLRPTAGYPTDARRFLEETAALRGRLGIDDAVLIRRR